MEKKQTNNIYDKYFPPKKKTAREMMAFIWKIILSILRIAVGVIILKLFCSTTEAFEELGMKLLGLVFVVHGIWTLYFTIKKNKESV